MHPHCLKHCRTVYRMWQVCLRFDREIGWNKLVCFQFDQKLKEMESMQADMIDNLNISCSNHEDENDLITDRLDQGAGCKESTPISMMALHNWQWEFIQGDKQNTLDSVLWTSHPTLLSVEEGCPSHWQSICKASKIAAFIFPAQRWKVGLKSWPVL